MWDIRNLAFLFVAIVCSCQVLTEKNRLSDKSGIAEQGSSSIQHARSIREAFPIKRIETNNGIIENQDGGMMFQRKAVNENLFIGRKTENVGKDMKDVKSSGLRSQGNVHTIRGPLYENELSRKTKKELSHGKQAINIGPFNIILNILCNIPVLKVLISFLCTSSSTTVAQGTSTQAATRLSSIITSTTNSSWTTSMVDNSTRSAGYSSPTPSINDITTSATTFPLSNTTIPPGKVKYIRNGFNNFCLSYTGTGTTGSLLVAAPCNDTVMKQGSFSVVPADGVRTSAFCISESICFGIQSYGSIQGHTKLALLMAKDLSSPAQQWVFHADSVNMPNHIINLLTKKCAEAFPIQSRGYAIIDTVECTSSNPAQEWTLGASFD